MATTTMMRLRNLGATSAALCVWLGCGPSVDTGSAGDGTGSSEGTAEQGSDAGTEPGTTAPNTGPVPTTAVPTTASTTGPVDSSSSGGPSGICGDSVVDADEGCDDGNAIGADGCSPACEVSGTVRWRVDLSSQRRSAYAVALDLRPPQAFVGVQLAEALTVDSLDMLVSRVDMDDVVVEGFFDREGFADAYIARQSLAGTADGDAIVGYGAGPRNLGRIAFGEGNVQWGDELSGWAGSFATIWHQDDVFTLRYRVDGGELAVLRFSDSGEFLNELPLGTTIDESFPLGTGAMLSTVYPWLSVILRADDGSAQYFTAMSPTADTVTWMVDELLGPGEGGEQARAFAHELQMDVWTDDSRVVIDMSNHVQPAVPRQVRGQVLSSFTAGYAIVSGDDLRELNVYGNDDQLRWSYEIETIPRYAHADGDVGLVVLSDMGPDFGTVFLEYLVL